MDIQFRSINKKTAEYLFWSALILCPLLLFVFNPNYDNVILKVTLKIFLASLAYLWLYQDSKQFANITERTRSLYFGPCLIIPEFAFLYYVFHSRGFKKGIVSTIKFVAKLLVAAFIIGCLDWLIEKYGLIYT